MVHDIRAAEADRSAADNLPGVNTGPGATGLDPEGDAPADGAGGACAEAGACFATGLVDCIGGLFVACCSF